MNQTCTWCQNGRTFLRDVAQGMFIITHSGLATVGLSALALVLALWLNPQWLHSAEGAVFNWLRDRQVLLSWLPQDTTERATALRVQDLPKPQAAVAEWLARKYKVAPEPVAALWPSLMPCRKRPSWLPISSWR